MAGMIFDPKPLFQDLRTPKEKRAARTGDQRDGKVYGYEPDVVLAINVALATGRPLLLRGHAGCGKSSVAFNVARLLKRCYYEQVVSSRMEARDLLWRFDAVRRLGDAQVRGASDAGAGEDWRSYYPYIEPGVLWWLFDTKSATRRGLPPEKKRTFPAATPPLRYRPASNTPLGKAVLLLDEIDKAEPDVPNNLLVALGSMEFRVEEIGKTVANRAAQEGTVNPEQLPLIIITTNEERQLPPAFLRRCVVYRFEPAKDKEAEAKRLVTIATKSEGRGPSNFFNVVATTMRKLAEEEAGTGAHVSIAEYLDAVRACKRLGETQDPEKIASIVERVIRKRPTRD